MAEYVAFLRGINVGGHKKIQMQDLRQAFASWGFQRAKTVLATGNILFESEMTEPGGVARTIEDKIRTAFGLDVGVIVRTLEEIRGLVESGPFAGVTVTPQTRLYVTFLSRRPDSDLQVPYESPEKDFKILGVSDGEVCSVLTLTPQRRTTDAMNVLEKQFGKDITTRNWNTIITGTPLLR